jgi:hypothetical protein
MRWALAPLMLFVLGSVAADVVSASTRSRVCPPETASTLRIVRRYATAQRMAEMRRRTHSPRVASGSVRLLVDSADAGACHRLMSGLAKHMRAQGHDSTTSHPTFYAAGGMFYGVERMPPHPLEGTGRLYIDSRWTPLYVFDEKMRVLYGF